MVNVLENCAQHLSIAPGQVSSRGLTAGTRTGWANRRQPTSRRRPSLPSRCTMVHRRLPASELPPSVDGLKGEPWAFRRRPRAIRRRLRAIRRRPRAIQRVSAGFSQCTHHRQPIEQFGAYVPGWRTSLTRASHSAPWSTRGRRPRRQTSGDKLHWSAEMGTVTIGKTRTWVARILPAGRGAPTSIPLTISASATWQRGAGARTLRGASPGPFGLQRELKFGPLGSASAPHGDVHDLVGELLQWNLHRFLHGQNRGHLSWHNNGNVNSLVQGLQQ